MQTFRDWCRENGRDYANPFQPSKMAWKGRFTPTNKKSGDLVIGIGGKVEAIR